MKVKLFERQYITEYRGCMRTEYTVLEPLEAFESRVNEFLAKQHGSVHFLDKNTIYIYYEE